MRLLRKEAPTVARVLVSGLETLPLPLSIPSLELVRVRAGVKGGYYYQLRANIA